jgi:hypothetical protein
MSTLAALTASDRLSGGTLGMGFAFVGVIHNPQAHARKSPSQGGAPKMSCFRFQLRCEQNQVYWSDLEGLGRLKNVANGCFTSQQVSGVMVQNKTQNY